MKGLKYFICVLAAVLLCAGSASAADVLPGQSGALELERLEQALPGEARDALRGVSPENAGLEGGLRSLWQKTAGELGGMLKNALKSSLLLIAVVVLGGMAASLAPEGEPSAVTLASVLAAALISVSETGSTIASARAVIEEMTVFSQILLPVLGSAAAAAGSPASATALYAATMAFSQLFMSLIKNFILPLTYAYIACCVANAALGGRVLARMAKLIKWAITLSLTVILFLYVGYLSVSGAVSGAADAVTVKAAKLTISTLVPVVGGMISDAAETVVAGAGILKNSVGVFGLLAVLAMCLGPFLQIAIKYLAYKLTAALASTVGDERVVGLIESISGAFGIVLGMVGASALMLFVSLISAVRMVV